ncbi:hypothetical protein [Streptomyces sp. NPDC006333]|uniref:hypothetical protein n=1 Tax=Streptomyces sp. NPDC006333 TaxID=3156753 RepID=UPI00339F1A21
MHISCTSRVLLASFSRPRESYHHGDPTTLKVGNAEVMARKNRDFIDRDVYCWAPPCHSTSGAAVQLPLRM